MANYKTKVKQNFINLLFDTYALTFKKMMTISKNYGTIGQKKKKENVLINSREIFCKLFYNIKVALLDVGQVTLSYSRHLPVLGLK